MYKSWPQEVKALADAASSKPEEVKPEEEEKKVKVSKKDQDGYEIVKDKNLEWKQWKKKMSLEDKKKFKFYLRKFILPNISKG